MLNAGHAHLRRAPIGRSRHGLSMIELMVGITIGLIVSAGASFLAVNQISEHRRIMIETQIQQDMRAVGEVLRQELHRAGYSAMDAFNIWTPPTTSTASAITAQPNPYAPITILNEGKDNSEIHYQYFTDKVDLAVSYSGTVPDYSKFGLRIKNSTLEFQLGLDNWQPLTDPEVIRFNKLSISADTQNIPLDDFCDKPCSGANCPSQTVRTLRIQTSGAAKSVPQLARTLAVVERPMTDDVSGVCP